MTSARCLARAGAAVSSAGEVIRGFTSPCCGASLVGTYSSIFIAAPFLIYLGRRTGPRDRRERRRRPPPRPMTFRRRRASADLGAARRHPASARGSAPIDGFGKGGFRFAGMSHRGSLLCLPSGIWAWAALHAGRYRPRPRSPGIRRGRCHRSSPAVGAGAAAGPLPDALNAHCRARQDRRSRSARTGTAVSTYNILLGEGRRVAAGADRGGLNAGLRQFHAGCLRPLRNAVRAGDKDRFLATLFAPQKYRRALCALYAFNLEVARTREQGARAAAGRNPAAMVARRAGRRRPGRGRLAHPGCCRAARHGGALSLCRRGCWRS